MRSSAAVASAPSVVKVDGRASDIKKETKSEKIDRKQSKAKDTGKGMDKDADVGMGIVPPGPAALPRRRRRRGRALRAGAPPFVPGAEFDDSWADGVVAATPALSGVLLPREVVVPPLDADAAVRGRRPLIARRSGSRSPRRSSPGAASPPPAAAAAPPVLALLEGRVATIQGLVSRPELERVIVDLKKFDASAGRWICSTKGGEQLRILPDKLQPIAESGQQFMRLRFGAD